MQQMAFISSRAQVFINGESGARMLHSVLILNCTSFPVSPGNFLHCRRHQYSLSIDLSLQQKSSCSSCDVTDQLIITMALILLRIMYESVPGSPLPYCSVSSCGGRARMRLDQGMVRLSGKEGITLVIIAGRGETCRQGGVSPQSVLSRWLFLLRGIQMHPRQHVQERSSFNCLTSLLLFSPWCEQQQ